MYVITLLKYKRFIVRLVETKHVMIRLELEMFLCHDIVKFHIQENLSLAATKFNLIIMCELHHKKSLLFYCRLRQSHQTNKGLCEIMILYFDL